MAGTAKVNAMRSGVVVLGALAFGYLTLQLGFKPFLEKAQLEQQRQESLLQAQSRNSFGDDDDSFHTEKTLSDSDYKPIQLANQALALKQAA